MTLRSDFPAARLPSGGPMSRGAAPVGILRELPAIELTAVLYLRSWCEGGAARDRIEQDFKLMLDPESADSALADFDALMQLALHCARRPLMRHGLECSCFGGDESAFANLIAAAAGQDREEAMLFACNLMTGPAAFQAERLAASVGRVLLRLSRIKANLHPAIDQPSPSSRQH